MNREYLYIETMFSRAGDLAQRYRKDMEKSFARICGYSAAQVKVLVHMNRSGGTILQKEIDSLLSLSRPTVSIMVDQLVEAGVICRDEADSDKRLKKLSLTPAGDAIARKAAGALNAYYKKFAENLSRQEIEAFSSTLNKMNLILEINSDQTTF